MRLLAVIASLVIGVLVGAWAMLTTQSPPSAIVSDATNGPSPATTDQAASTSSSSLRPTPTTAPAPASDQVLLVWTPGGLPEGFAEGVRDLPGVATVTVVRSGLLHLTSATPASGKAEHRAPDGFVIPMEAVAIDPASYTEIVSGPQAAPLRGLGSGETILGETSADLRGLGPGGELALADGTRLTVVAVVDDVMIGAAEAAITVDSADDLGLDTERFLLIRYSGQRKALEDAVRETLPSGLGVRVRAPGETPVLRHGDAVLPQVMIKEIFGEFAYRPSSDGSFGLDSQWFTDNIVTAEVPLLGSVTCHRNLVPALRGAMEELERRNLGSLVRDTQGCFNPRFIDGKKGISRHAWGAAIDINIGSNPEGLESVQDPRLLKVMEQWGFTSGHEWLVPDPGHFEYVTPPR